MNGNAYYEDRQLRRDVMRYASAEVEKHKTPKQMMDAISEFLDHCAMDASTLSDYPYGYELADLLVNRLNVLSASGKLKSSDAERWSTLKDKYYDYIMRT